MPKTSLDLTGQWQFKQYPPSARRLRDLDSADWHDTAVPCSIFNSLVSAGQIKKQDLESNPENFAQVSEKPWIYKKNFDASAELLACDRIDLVFEGLDTIASIWLNGKLIAKTNNMFIPFRFDVTGAIKPRNNTLMVKFDPAEQHAKKLMDRYTTFNESDFSNPHRVYIRKAQYQFGWDFCPALPGCGIWRPVGAEGIKKAGIADVHLRTIDCNPDYADVKIAVKLDIVMDQQFLCQLTLSCLDQLVEQTLTFEAGENLQTAVIRIEKPFLWFPAGYGPQNLYQLEAQLSAGGEIIDQMQKQVGIRNVKLNLSADEHNPDFQFEVNGQPVFVRGANWVPASIFAGQATKDDYHQLLHTAAGANINMLRVWGGGHYETQHFYDLCDQLGIMVWQDFMFACAYYPDRKWFTEQVKAEALEIIKQLRNHPALVLWCGNNEIDWMHHTGKLGTGKKFYGKAIYHKLLPKLAADLDPDTAYIPTTPLYQEGDFKTDQPLTTHRWDIWSGHQPIRQYHCRSEQVPHFVTEFGIQSLPHIETIGNLCPPGQLHVGSYSIEKHNYQLDGNSRLYRYIGDLFGCAQDIEQMVYLSQITQARAYKTYVEYLRAHNARNHGVLFWQFNDCSPAISWSATDYTKKPKALYYYAKRFFSDLLVTALPQSDKAKNSPDIPLHPVSVTAINDSPQPVTAALNCRLLDLSGATIDYVEFPIAIAPFSITAMLTLPKAIVSPTNPQKSCLHLVMDNDGEKIAENLIFYLPDKYIDWPQAQITTRCRQITDSQWKLKLKSNVVTKDVQIITAVPAKFSDNFIDLVPPDESEITIDCLQPTASLESVLHLRCIKSPSNVKL